ncbi:hypothetical protein DH2020_000467 [Rehmannia glutinosa]|uniref:Uncharacterized protein n=1 Tax=Rehmannia glutinosa TaxID=99300 RepID=A0ABR0XX12_REHGL
MADAVNFLEENFRKFLKWMEENQKIKSVSNHAALIAILDHGHADFFGKFHVTSHVATSVPTPIKTDDNSVTASKGKNISSIDELVDSYSDYNSDNDVPSEEEVQHMYKHMFEKFIEIRCTNKSLEERITELSCQNAMLEHEVQHCREQIAERDKTLEDTLAELKDVKASLSKMNTGKTKLNEILSTGKLRGNRQSLDYIGENSNSKRDPKNDIQFVKGANSNTPIPQSEAAAAVAKTTNTAPHLLRPSVSPFMTLYQRDFEKSKKPASGGAKDES